MNWERLNSSRKRLVLLWLYILRTEPIEEIARSFLEPKFIDIDQDIDPNDIPAHIFMMKPNQLLSELNKVGGPPAWKIQ